MADSSQRFQARQGDVLLIGIDNPPPQGARPVEPEDGRIVLARGEATGHAHVIEEDRACLFETPDGARYLRVGAPAALRHPEHADILLPYGTYIVRRQREYESGGPRGVSD